jgi:hypothetical protein
VVISARTTNHVIISLLYSSTHFPWSRQSLLYAKAPLGFLADRLAMDTTQLYDIAPHDPLDTTNKYWLSHSSAGLPLLSPTFLTPSSAPYHNSLSDFGLVDGAQVSSDSAYPTVETWRPLYHDGSLIPRNLSVSSVQVCFGSENLDSLPLPAKPIRFVSDNGQPHAKRRRVSVA